MPLLPASILQAASGHLPDVLVPTSSWATMQQLADRLPPAFNWLGFECRLDADTRVDFAGCCEVWDGGREQLVAAVAADPTFAGQGPAALIKAWGEPSSDLAEGCPAVWLEFDVLEREGVIPFAFLCLDPACANTFRAQRHPPPPPPPDALLAVASKAASLLSDGAPHEKALEIFARCIQALPRHGRALHMAATPHRGHTDLRLHFSMLAGDLVEWLEAVEWPGDFKHVRTIAGLLKHDFRQVGVQVAAGDVMRPELGIELYVGGGGASREGWPDTLARMVELGLAQPAKAEALMAWWGSETTKLPGVTWPVRIERQFYVKLKLKADKLAAKGYLALFPSFAVW